MFKVKNISVFELQEMIQNQEDIHLIDVREQFERDMCSLGGELMSVQEIQTNIDKIPKTKKVIIYCHYGDRSFFITNMLTAIKKLENIYNLKGGINAWANKIDSKMKKY